MQRNILVCVERLWCAGASRERLTPSDQVGQSGTTRSVVEKNRTRTLAQKRHKSNLVSARVHLTAGERKGNLTPLNRVVVGITGSNPMLAKKKSHGKNKTISTVESQHEDRPMTLNAKSSSSGNDTLRTMSSETLDQDLTSEEEDSVPWWTRSCKEASMRLWCPHPTDYLDSALNYSSRSSMRKGERSLFSIRRKYPLNRNLLMTSSPFSPASHHVYTGYARTCTASRRVYLRPTRDQKKTLVLWMGMWRWYYNRTLEFIKERLDQKVKGAASWQKVKTAMKARYKYNQPESYPVWFRPCGGCNKCKANKACTVPVRFLDGAVIRASKSYAANLEAVKDGRIKSFEMKFKTQKDPIQSFAVFKDEFSSKNGFDVSVLGEMASNKVVNKKTITKDATLVYDTVLDTFCLMVPYIVNTHPVEKTTKKVGLDPGEKDFLNGYSESNERVAIGRKCRSIFKYFHRNLDKLVSKIKTTKNKKKKQAYKKAASRIRRKLKDKTRDLHAQTVSFLTKEYSGGIMMGDLKVSQVIKNNVAGREYKAYKRSLLCLSLFALKQRLKWKCNVLKIPYKEVDEKYTTKGCTRCGAYNRPADREYNCKHCGLKIGRDVAASRNIYIKGTT